MKLKITTPYILFGRQSSSRCSVGHRSICFQFH